MYQIWQYQDGAGNTVKGVYWGSKEVQGTDVTYFFRRLPFDDSGNIDVVSGQRLKNAVRVGALETLPVDKS